MVFILVFSGIRVAHLLLLLCMYDFSYFMFFVVYFCFLCLVFVPELHFLYNIGSPDYSVALTFLKYQPISVEKCV